MDVLRSDLKEYMTTIQHLLWRNATTEPFYMQYGITTDALSHTLYFTLHIGYWFTDGSTQHLYDLPIKSKMDMRNIGLWIRDRFPEITDGFSIAKPTQEIDEIIISKAKSL